MCIFSGMIRRFSTARNTKLNSRIAHKESLPANQPTKAPLPKGFDATKLDTFAKKGSMASSSPYNQLNACLNDFSASPASLPLKDAVYAKDMLALKHANTEPIQQSIVSQQGMPMRRSVTFEPVVKEHCPINGTTPDRAHNPSYHSDQYSTREKYR